MRYLIDTSALVRILRRQVDEAWLSSVARGLGAIGEPVIIDEDSAQSTYNVVGSHVAGWFSFQPLFERIETSGAPSFQTVAASARPANRG